MSEKRDTESLEPGEAIIRPAVKGDVHGHYCWYLCPRNKGVCAVPIKPLSNPPHNTGWYWDGSVERATLTPSILCHGCEWHGYVRNGTLVDA